MKIAFLATALVAAAPLGAWAQSVTVRERVTYEKVTTYELPAVVRQLHGARNISYTNEKVLPWPYHHFVKGTADNLVQEDHGLLQPIASKGIMLCDAEQNAYSLAARQWQGQSNEQAAFNIAKVLDRLDSRWPCGYSDGLVLSDFHFSLRTARDTRYREPSYVFRWTDQFGYYHYSSMKASLIVFQRRTAQQ